MCLVGFVFDFDFGSLIVSLLFGGWLFGCVAFVCLLWVVCLFELFEFGWW